MCNYTKGVPRSSGDENLTEIQFDVDFEFVSSRTDHLLMHTPDPVSSLSVHGCSGGRALPRSLEII